MFEVRVLSGKSRVRADLEMLAIGCQDRGVDIMLPKSMHNLVYARNLDPRAANIVKQEFLAAGGEAAVPWKSLELHDERCEMIMMGTQAQFHRVTTKLLEQPFSLDVLSNEIKTALKNYNSMPELPWGGKYTQIMGILNVTPDSFYDGGKWDDPKVAVKRGIEMVEQGADIIDIGGESTRPGSKGITVDEELKRIVPIIKELASSIDVPISIDTHKPMVARAAVEAGASVINDVYGLRDKDMLETVAELDTPVVIMHMQGTPEIMQGSPTYENVVGEVYGFLRSRTREAMEAGINKNNLIIDPGIGFGKKLIHNLELIDRIDEFKSMGFPVLLGASRKSMFEHILDKGAEDRIFGSLAVAALAIDRGVSLLRVHDVKETYDVIRTIDSVVNRNH